MNISQYLESSARNYPNRVAIRFEGQQITFKELDVDCNRMANGFTDLGLRPKDVCVLMMPNSLNFIKAYYALAKIGACVVPMNFLYRVHELEHIFKDSKPKGFIGTEPYLEEVRKVLIKVKRPSIRLAFGVKQDPDFVSLEDIYADKKDFSTYPSDDNDTWVIIYSSGTTGVPKGVMLTHRNLPSNSRIVSEMRGDLDASTLFIGVIPFYHVHGQTSVLNSAIYLGLTIELFSRFDPEKVIKVIKEEERPTVLFGPPTMYNRLTQVATQKGLKRSSLKFVVSGGSSLPVELIERFESIFKTKIYEGYGLTEAPVCVENPYKGLTKPGSIGFAIPECSAKIVNKRGEEVDYDQVGELIIKGPVVMKGYLNRPKETEETIKDGWLYTGDLARMDEDGYIYIVDRKKDLVIRGGYNVYPREIEEVLYQIPEVLEAAVMGVPHEDLGEEELQWWC